MSENHRNASELREEIGHPIVDADGHWIETAPVMKGFFLDFVKDLGGGDLAARFEAAGGLDYDDSLPFALNVHRRCTFSSTFC